MLTIALDEAGVFDTGSEERYTDSKTTLIGGITFGDNGIENEIVNERKRIEAYYRQVIDEVNLSNLGDKNAAFPEDLHVNGKNNSTVAKVKEAVKGTLGEFIRAGTYKNSDLSFDGKKLPKREGVYYICAVVKSKNGKSELLQSELGTFFRDGYASNIYFHMMSEAVEHFIFHNPLCRNEQLFRLDIATRISADITDKDSIEVYESQGYKGNETNNKNTNAGAFAKAMEAANIASANNRSQHYGLMNADVFRTIMTEQMLSSEHKKLQIDSFYVDSIRYKYDSKGGKKVLRHEDQIFMFLADSVCTYLTYHIGRDDIEDVLGRSGALAGDNILVFSYDEVDEYLKKAIRALESNEFCNALRQSYRIYITKSAESEFYRKKWIPYIEKRIVEYVKEDKRSGERSSVIFEAVQELRNAFLTNRLRIDESFYIFGILEKACETLGDDDIYDEIRYYLSDIGLRAYCHKGEPQKAEEYYKKCVKYASSAKLEEYIRSRNQYSVALLDLFAYEKAIGIIRGTIELTEGLVNLSRTHLQSQANQFGKYDLARTLSLAGQCASFMGDGESAQNYFKEALEIIDDREETRKRTESYWIHYVIDYKKEDDYEFCMKLYTGEKEPDKMLSAIVRNAENGLVSLRYALYLYLKGLYNFGKKEEIESVWNEIKNCVDSLDVRDRTGHPWQMINKYLCLMAIMAEDEDAFRKYKNQIIDSVSGGRDSLVSIIALSCKAFVCGEKGNTEEEIKLYSEAYDLLAENYPLAVSKGSLTDGMQKKNVVVNKLRYMYR